VTEQAPVSDPVIVSGTSGRDRLSGVEDGVSRVEGKADNDVLTGVKNGYAELVGGTGNDRYLVKSTNDVVTEAAGEGTDTVVTDVDYTLTANVEILRMNDGAIKGTGNDLNNRIVGSSDDNIIDGMAGRDVIQGLDGNDTINGGAGNDRISGDNGNDRLFGDAGNDLLTGDAGNDFLYGGDGKDILEGGAGSDFLSGGAGNDVFRYRIDDIASFAVDTIADFQSGQDRVSLSLIDANTKTSGDDSFTFIGESNFHKVAGELRAQTVGGDTYVYGDVNGDGQADFGIYLKGVQSVSTQDFIL